jgi:hypothetical protein
VRVAADADVAVHQQHMRPPSLARQRGEHVPAQRRPAPAAGQRDRRGGGVDAQAVDAAGGQFGGEPAGAAADVDGRAAASVDDVPGGWLWVVVPAPQRQVGAPPVGAVQPARAGRVGRGVCAVEAGVHLVDGGGEAAAWQLAGDGARRVPRVHIG